MFQHKQYIGVGDHRQQPPFDDKNRPNRVVCPYSPIGGGDEDSPLMAQLKATGLVALELRYSYRSEPELELLLNPLRDGIFNAPEHERMSQAGSEVQAVFDLEEVFDEYTQTRRTWDFVVSAEKATVLYCTKKLVKAYTDRKMKDAGVTEKVKCKDVKETPIDPRQRIVSNDLDDYLDGAPAVLELCAGCPVRLGRSMKGEKLSCPGDGVAAQPDLASPSTIF